MTNRTERDAFKGIIPILITPFDHEGRVDTDSLQSLIDFNLSAGVNGLGIAIGSELFKLSNKERKHLLDVVVARVNGQVPVIMNTSAQGTQLAVALASEAEQANADALMIYPPSFMPTGNAAMVEHYQAVSAAVSLPLILQDVPQGPIGPSVALHIRNAAPTLRAIKVETLPTVSQVAAMSQAVQDTLTIIGGAGGSYMIEEYRRGARGTMPFCSQPADFVAVWNYLEAGNEQRARAVFDQRIMAINRLGAQQADVFYALHKQLLVRQGVIANALVRAPTASVDAITQREIDEVIEGYL